MYLWPDDCRCRDHTHVVPRACTESIAPRLNHRVRHPVRQELIEQLAVLHSSTSIKAVTVLEVVAPMQDFKRLAYHTC
jgi:hypothetical protein